MSHTTTFLKSLLFGPVSSGRRFVRLTPQRRPGIYFLDKKTRSIFRIHSRGDIDSAVADQIYTFHDYQLDGLCRYEELWALYRNIIERGKTPLIVDCGANIGLSARYFSIEFPESRVIALEPEARNFAAANRNCSDRKNVFLRKCGVGSTRGFVSISNPDEASWCYQTTRDEPGADIELITINDLLDADEGMEPFIVKIDIEGFEADLFAANIEWIRRTPLVIVETHDWKMPGKAISGNFLRAIGREKRDFVHRGENIFSIRNPVTATFGRDGSGNVETGRDRGPERSSS